MSTRKPSIRNRALRPMPEDLEDRRLLSAVVSGTDIDGDTWTLRLIGPGSLVVTKTNDAKGDPLPAKTPSEINTITIGGTEPLVSRLIGTVKKGPNGDGKVFFNNLTELSGKAERSSGGQGLLSIVMPNFWLGKTIPRPATTSTTAPTPAVPSIVIPDGVDTLQFGGVDTTHGVTNPPATGATSDIEAVTLGLPTYGGTRVLIDKSISSSQQVAAVGTTPASTLQHAVEFNVVGRLNLFQANTIAGDAVNPPGQFSELNPSVTTSGTALGGTFVVSGTAGSAPFLTNNQLQGNGVTGQIANLRIGGDATNLSALTFDGTGGGDGRISNFSIGGETNNVLVIAPNGLHNAYFGRGLDKTEIFAHVINALQANRGALNSNVTVDRTISQITFGGDVVNTRVLSGEMQNYGSIISAITGQNTSNNPFASSQPSAPPLPENAQTGGGMQVHVAGDVTDSVFAASVQPKVDTTTTPASFLFGTPQDGVLPSGHISAKVEGKINNTNATPDQPKHAFYAQVVSLKAGPVVPPNVPSPPYSGPKRPIHEPGLHNPFHLRPFTANPADIHIPSRAGHTSLLRTKANPHGTAITVASVPKGPRASAPSPSHRHATTTKKE